jgi:hypothetical protein
VEYFEGRKEEHFKQDLGYILSKICIFEIQMQLTTWAEVTTFQQGNCYISKTLLSIVSTIEKGMG